MTLTFELRPRDLEMTLRVYAPWQTNYRSQLAVTFGDLLSS